MPARKPRTITVRASELHRLARVVLPFTARGDEWMWMPVLHAIYLSTHGGYLVAEATDRFRAAAFRVPIPTGDAAPDGANTRTDGFRAHIDTTELRRILGMIKGTRREDPWLAITDGPLHTVTITTLKSDDGMQALVPITTSTSPVQFTSQKMADGASACGWPGLRKILSVAIGGKPDGGLTIAPDTPDGVNFTMFAALANLSPRDLTGTWRGPAVAGTLELAHNERMYAFRVGPDLIGCVMRRSGVVEDLGPVDTWQEYVALDYAPE